MKKASVQKPIDWGKLVLSALPLGIALVTTTTPASAQSTIIIEGGYPNGGYDYPNNYPDDRYYYPPTQNQPPTAAPFVYGSPIPAPGPVDPNTGLPPKNNDTYSYPVYSDRYEYRERDYPVLVNPRSRYREDRREPRLRGSTTDRR